MVWNGVNSKWRISEISNVNIRYFPVNNFFIVNNYTSSEDFNPIKIDSLGDTIFQLHLTRKDDFNFVDQINCFVIGANGIFDFSADKPTAVPFSTVLNKDNTLPSEKWIQTFEEQYKQADIVLYGWITDLQMAQCVYFQSAGKWTKLYTFLNSGGKNGQIDHLIPVQIDHLFRLKLTTQFRIKLTT